MRVELTASAETDYSNIVEYSFTEFGEQIANEYADALDGTFARLESHPELGRTETDLRGSIRSLGCRSHRVFYTIDEDRVVVRRILHKSMNVKNWLD